MSATFPGCYGSLSIMEHNCMNRSTRWLLVVLLVFAGGMSGCGGRPETAQVRGKVLYKDGTVPTGGVCVVQFQPAADTSAEIRKAASSEIQPDGSFEAYTRKPGDGVFLGKYNVTFSVWKGPMEPVSLIADKYTKADTTPHTVEVEGDRDDLLFEIEPVRRGPRIP